MVDLDARTARLDDYLDETGTDAVWFARPTSFAWLTGGSNVVDRTADIGIAAAGYVREDETEDTDDDTRGSLHVLATEDADRLAAEEVPDAFEVMRAPWHEWSLADVVTARSPENAAADFPISGFDSVDPTTLRQPLTDDDVEQYRRLGEETAAAVERVCRELSPQDTEHEVASALRITLSSGAMEAPTVLVSGADRAEQYGVSPPTGAALGDFAVVSVTTERGGMHASLTRTVAFDPPEGFHERHRAAARVGASALAATRAVASEDGVAGDVFEEIQAAYDALGYTDAWEGRPQGGAAGFARHEWVAAPDSTERVDAPMAYAWNPTIGGARSEDTYLVTTDSTSGGQGTDDEGANGDALGFECLTATPNWPTIDVQAVDRDVTIERHGIYEP